MRLKEYWFEEMIKNGIDSEEAEIYLDFINDMIEEKFNERFGSLETQDTFEYRLKEATLKLEHDTHIIILLFLFNLLIFITFICLW